MNDETPDRVHHALNKLKNRRWNERIKSYASFSNSLGLGVIGFGVLRFVSDNETERPSGWVIAGAPGTAILCVAAGSYILGYLRSED
ncbi:hypothetical protein SAMN06297251_10877 [Fulvimarina manganoxydans]|uniref:Uncharacterized protein n=1 Tax=Fulvimarina manganoxydans TaxID=937218 RepID=A0A1W2C0Y5_9HYPH|nr:hypothetical protein [Fulvimarina manganoxydans]MCK5934070.1 hypothetical protein [Fulvimarina manganoxydans]SMC78810.1 hypothetical protein SAMN06297251_10877 [Fulvimarina manganoxydans]